MADLDTLLRKASQFDDRIAGWLGHVPYTVRKVLGYVFAAYIWSWTILVVLNGRFWDIDKDVLFVAALPALVLGGAVMAYYGLVHIPIGALQSLYAYLREKDIPPSHAIWIALFAVIGAVTVLVLLARH